MSAWTVVIVTYGLAAVVSFGVAALIHGMSVLILRTGATRAPSDRTALPSALPPSAATAPGLAAGAVPPAEIAVVIAAVEAYRRTQAQAGGAAPPG